MLIHKKLAREEKRLGGSLDYVRHILKVSRRAFFALARCLHLAEYRREAPPEVLAVAGMVGAMRQDCGTCVQIAINQSKQQQTDGDVLQAVLDRAPDRLPADLATVYGFATAVVAGDDVKAHELRDKVQTRYGEAALIEIAYALAMGQFFPTIKRTLGYAESCAIKPPTV